jgi:hypothetical protein
MPFKMAANRISRFLGLFRGHDYHLYIVRSFNIARSFDTDDDAKGRGPIELKYNYFSPPNVLLDDLI